LLGACVASLYRLTRFSASRSSGSASVNFEAPQPGRYFRSRLRLAGQPRLRAPASSPRLMPICHRWPSLTCRRGSVPLRW
jgi:hypothetical protein